MQDMWGADEKVRDKKRRIAAVMDLAARRMRAWDTSDTKENHDAAHLLRAAKDRAGKIPRPHIADGLDQYHIAFRKVFYTLKGLRPIPLRDIHLRNRICNTSKQERLGGEFTSPFRPARGINKKESLIFHLAAQLHQAPWRHKRQDAGRGRWHRHTRN